LQVAKGWTDRSEKLSARDQTLCPHDAALLEHVVLPEPRFFFSFFWRLPRNRTRLLATQSSTSCIKAIDTIQKTIRENPRRLPRNRTRWVQRNLSTNRIKAANTTRERKRVAPQQIS
jgi:hypothetical protein